MLQVLLLQDGHEIFDTHGPRLSVRTARPKALVLAVIMLRGDLPQRCGERVLEGKGQVGLSLHGLDEGIA